MFEMDNELYKKVAENSKRVIAENQKLKLQLAKYEEIIMEYVNSDMIQKSKIDELEGNVEELEFNLKSLQKEFDDYKNEQDDFISENFNPKSSSEMYGISERDFV